MKLYSNTCQGNILSDTTDNTKWNFRENEFVYISNFDYKRKKNGWKYLAFVCVVFFLLKMGICKSVKASSHPPPFQFSNTDWALSSVPYSKKVRLNWLTFFYLFIYVYRKSYNLYYIKSSKVYIHKHFPLLWNLVICLLIKI